MNPLRQMVNSAGSRMGLHLFEARDKPFLLLLLDTLVGRFELEWSWVDALMQMSRTDVT